MGDQLAIEYCIDDMEVIDELPCSFWMSLGREDNFEIQYWNRGSETIYGYSKEEALGKNYLDLFVGDNPTVREQSAEDCDQVIAQNSHPRNCIAIDTDARGNEVVLLTNVFRVESNGHYLHAELAIDLGPSEFQKFFDKEYLEYRDGSKHAERRTLQSLIDFTVSKVKRRRDQWSRAFAHEIRSEVGSIKHSLTELKQEFPGIESSRHFRNVQRANASLFLASSNFTSWEQRDGAAYDTEAFTVTDEVESSLSNQEHFAYSKNISLNEICTNIAQGVKLRGNSGIFTNTLSNIFSNAIKHSPAKRDSLQCVDVEVADSHDYLTIEIYNVGQLSDEQIANAFVPYFKSETSPTEGLHLGLSLAKSWVESVGGRLLIENQLSGKVKVRLDWPKYQRKVDQK